MNQMRMKVLATLKQVWKAASTKLSLAALAMNTLDSTVPLTIVTS